MTSQYALIIMSLLIALAGFGLYIWAARTGQFEDTEDTKYQVFDEDDDQQAPPPDQDTTHSQTEKK
ncbi:MAG: cbb3-type cytochrome oxidase assembly protein CcoS [Bacteroidetes bacterium]|nr:cbb3-type cytochrome oxidase assembly protein CcoS [Bacteroidota bacterium]